MNYLLLTQNSPYLHFTLENNIWFLSKNFYRTENFQQLLE